MEPAADAQQPLDPKTAEKVRRAKRRPLALKILLSALISLGSFIAVSGAYVITAAALGDPEAEKSSTALIALGPALVVAVVIAILLAQRAYPPGEGHWGTWILATVVIAIIPLLYLPWAFVTRRNWPDPPPPSDDSPETGATAAFSSSTAAKLIAGAILVGAVIIGGAIVLTSSDAGGDHANLSRDQVEAIAEDIEPEVADTYAAFGGGNLGERSIDAVYSSNGGEVWIVEWSNGACVTVWSPAADSDRYYTGEC